MKNIKFWAGHLEIRYLPVVKKYGIVFYYHDKERKGQSELIGQNFILFTNDKVRDKNESKRVAG